MALNFVLENNCIWGLKPHKHSSKPPNKDYSTIAWGSPKEDSCLKPVCWVPRSSAGVQPVSLNLGKKNTKTNGRPQGFLDPTGSPLTSRRLRGAASAGTPGSTGSTSDTEASKGKDLVPTSGSAGLTSDTEASKKGTWDLGVPTGVHGHPNGVPVRQELSNMPLGAY